MKITAGFGRSDITPRLGVQLAGYGPYRNREAREIVAPLHARAMVVQADDRRTVLLSVELCGVTRELDQHIRRRVAAAASCDEADVFVSVTHTHSAPAVGGMFGWGEPDLMYVETLPTRVVEAVLQAIERLEAVQWRHAEVSCEGIAVNRETDTGFALNANLAERLKPSWRPDRPQDTDPTLRVLGAYAGDRLVGILHHFGCHPVVYGEKTNAVHGDFVGEASRRLEQEHADAVVMFLPGALGDINPKLNHRSPRESARALRAISQQYERVLRRGLAAAAPIEVAVVNSRRTRLRAQRLPWTREQVDQRIAQLRALFARPGVTDLPHTGGEPPLLTLGMERARLEGLRAVRRQFRGPSAPNPAVTLHGLRIGPVVLLGCGLELYHRLQAPIMADSPHEHTWVVSLVGGMGYAPDRAGRDRAGYSADFVPLIGGEIPFADIHHELPQALGRLARGLVD